MSASTLARRGLLAAGALLLALAAAAPSAAADAVPFLSGRVVDGADLLPPTAEAELVTRLEALERETGAQVVVLTVPSLGDEPIEDYAVRVAQAWKLGREGVDDGVLFVMAATERALRIEVGYGLEAKLPDIMAKRILDERVVPRFRAGDFPGGVAAGVDAIALAVRGGDPLPPPQPSGNQLGDLSAGGRIGMLLVFTVFMLPFALAAIFTPGCGGWVLWAFLLPFLGGIPFAALGGRGLLLGLAWLVLVPPLRLWVARRPAGRRFARRLRPPGGWFSGGTPGTGWSGGSRGGGYGGGGFSGGGGGFSGGGGSFGGGGASSRW